MLHLNQNTVRTHQRTGQLWELIFADHQMKETVLYQPEQNKVESTEEKTKVKRAVS